MLTARADLVFLAACTGGVVSGLVLYLIGRWIDPTRKR
jgi:membrane protein DedA with SNARE-associated domain